MNNIRYDETPERRAINAAMLKHRQAITSETPNPNADWDLVQTVVNIVPYYARNLLYKLKISDKGDQQAYWTLALHKTVTSKSFRKRDDLHAGGLLTIAYWRVLDVLRELKVIHRNNKAFLDTVPLADCHDVPCNSHLAMDYIDLMTPEEFDSYITY